MRLDETLFNLEKFHLQTKEKWRHEPFEAFQCANCDLIVLGMPDCHKAFIDPYDLSKFVAYNLPRSVACPRCKYVWYDGHSLASYNVEDVSLEELFLSSWGMFISKK